MTGLHRDQLEEPRWSVMLRRENKAGNITAERLKRESARGARTQTVLTGLLLLHQNKFRIVICQRKSEHL